MGHAYFSRAMAYRELALHFCKDYNPSTAASEYGVPLVDTYNPGPNAETYPGRSSLQETYQHIVNDLTKAEEYVTTAGVVNSTKITADVVQVLKARVALDMEDYTTAANVAQALISKGTYTLISDPAQYKDMWLNDTGTEAIWQFYMELKTKKDQPHLEACYQESSTSSHVPHTWQARRLLICMTPKTISDTELTSRQILSMHRLYLTSWEPTATNGPETRLCILENPTT